MYKILIKDAIEAHRDDGSIALKGEKNQPFAVPDGLTFMRVNRRSGASAASDPDGMIIQEAFKVGQKPNLAPRKNAPGQSPVVGGVF